MGLAGGPSDLVCRLAVAIIKGSAAFPAASCPSATTFRIFFRRIAAGVTLLYALSGIILMATYTVRIALCAVRLATVGVG